MEVDSEPSSSRKFTSESGPEGQSIRSPHNRDDIDTGRDLCHSEHLPFKGTVGIGSGSWHLPPLSLRTDIIELPLNCGSTSRSRKFLRGMC